MHYWLYISKNSKLLKAHQFSNIYFNKTRAKVVGTNKAGRQGRQTRQAGWVDYRHDYAMAFCFGYLGQYGTSRKNPICELS
jgi:hypothetical protein